MTEDLTWIEAALISARPHAMAALTRYFRDLDLAEEAYQEACLRALTKWPVQGPPRDPARWLILVARNCGVDALRRRNRETTLPDELPQTDLDDTEAALAHGLDDADYADDILRLLFVCCHPDLPDTASIPLALRIVCGVPVAKIARAFLVDAKAMEQRITRAKARVAEAGVPFDPPGPAERAERLRAVAATAYLLFNEGYSAIGSDARDREAMCVEAIRIARLLLHLFPQEPELAGLLALMLAQHSRSATRLDGAGGVVLLDQQDRTRWNRAMIVEAGALLEKARRHGAPESYRLQAEIAATHACAPTANDTDWKKIERLYASLEAVQPSPVVSLNRAVAVSKIEGPQAALNCIVPLEGKLDGYFYYHGLRGALLRDLGRLEEARTAFAAAISLAGSLPEAGYIRQQLDAIA